MPRTSQSLTNYLSIMVGAWRDDPRDDAALLARFAEGGDKVAFQALVGRHGLLVWRTCRRVLGDTPDAEDAFQTVFLALARKAGRFPVENLAGWLHRVARQAAMDVRAGARRRRGLEQRLKAGEAAGGASESASRTELHAALDEELAYLPERLRVPLLLHYLEGKSQLEVARILGCSRGVVQYRLARGEAVLRKRLEQRGLAVDFGSVAMLLGDTPGALAVPAGLMGSTVRVALRSLSFPPPLESSETAALAAGVLKTTLVTKMKLAAVLLGMTLCLAGGGVLAYQTLAGNALNPLQPVGEPGGGAEPFRQFDRARREVEWLDRQGDPLPPGALARLGTLRLRHAGWVYAVAFSPDGKTVASAGDVVRLWEAATGKEIGTLKGHQGEVFSVIFSPDGKTVASGGGDSTVRLWNAASGKEIRTLKGHKGRVWSVAFSPDGKTMASAGCDVARLWDAVSGKEICTLPAREGKIQRVALSPDGKIVASGANDGEVRLWETASGKEIRTLKEVGEVVNSIALSPDGKIVAAGADDGAVCLWETASGKEIRTLKGHKMPVMSIAFSPDGKVVASAGYDDGVRLWETVTGKEIPSPKWSGERILGVRFSPDGKTIACGGCLGVMRLMETVTGKETIRVPEGHEGPVLVAAFLTDGKTVITGGMDGMVRQWETVSGKELRALWGRHKTYVHSVAFSPNGKIVGLAGNESTVRLCETFSGKEISTFRGHREGEVCAAAFSSDSKIVASVGGDGMVHLWDVVSGKELRARHHMQEHKRPVYPVYSVAFSPDGKVVASGGYDGTLCLWEAATGRKIRTLQVDKDRVLSVVFSTDGKVVVSTGPDGTVRLWEAATGKEIRTLQGCKDKRQCKKGLAFSPDNRILAAGSGDCVQLWDVLSGTALPPLTGHRSEVNGVIFSPDNKLLVSVSMDSTCLVWDLTYGAARMTAKLSPDVLSVLWAELASADALQAWRAVWTLAATPAQSVPLLRDHLQPVTAGAGKQVLRLIADLDADVFQVRERAQQELGKLVPEVEPALLKALEGKPSEEMRRRLEQLLEAAKTQNRRGFSVEEFRSLRAVVVLERIGTPEAVEVLKTLAGGASGFRLTQEAQAALRRLGGVRRP